MQNEVLVDVYATSQLAIHGTVQLLCPGELCAVHAVCGLVCGLCYHQRIQSTLLPARTRHQQLAQLRCAVQRHRKQQPASHCRPMPPAVRMSVTRPQSCHPLVPVLLSSHHMGLRWHAARAHHPTISNRPSSVDAVHKLSAPVPSHKRGPMLQAWVQHDPGRQQHGHGAFPLHQAVPLRCRGKLPARGDMSAVR